MRAPETQYLTALELGLPSGVRVVVTAADFIEDSTLAGVLEQTIEALESLRRIYAEVPDADRRQP